MTKTEAKILLKKWFRQHHAHLPWRPDNLNEKRNPYFVWISEIMLQQTQVEAVKKHYENWVKDYPDVFTLARADETDVLLHWQGLGYYSRAKNIHKTAGILAEKWNGKFPQTRPELEALPGIGKYTAGAILSFAFHQKEPILDGNLIRIFSRLHLFDFLPAGKKETGIYWNEAANWAHDREPHQINEALMELGRVLCKVQNPLCGQCPLQKICKAGMQKRTAEFPPKKETIRENWSGVILVIESTDQKILSIRESDARFLKNQRSLPLFEYSKAHTRGLPGAAEKWVSPEAIADYQWLSKPVRHSITKFKMECGVLHIRLKKKAPKNNPMWVPRIQTSNAFANKLCLKALELIEAQS